MGRNDAVLMLGLTVALFVIFTRSQSQPCWTTSVTSKRQGIAPASRAGDSRHDLSALPSTAQASGDPRRVGCCGARAAQEATERAAEMSRLVAFGHALARTHGQRVERLDSAACCTRICPLAPPGRGVWVMTRTRAGQWEPQATVGESMPADRERAARRALGEADPVVGPSPRDLLPDDHRGCA